MASRCQRTKWLQNKTVAEPLPEPLNRCAAVTDKTKSAWQKRAIRCKTAAVKPVLRGQFVVSCPHGAGCMMEARVSSAFESLRAGVPHLERVPEGTLAP